MRILGVDPGTVATGWGVVEAGDPPRAAAPRRIAGGVIRCRGELPARLADIFAAVRAILAEHRPAALSLEKTFVSDNVQSAFRLGEARGSILVAAAQAGVPVHEYSPAEIKVAVVGYGRAVKEQVQGMVVRLLGLSAAPAADEADALAAALCHLHSQRLQALAGGAGRLAAGAGRRPALALMIAHLSGILASKSPEGAVVDIHGVGFQVLLSLHSFYRLPEPGHAVRLLTYTHVREDALQLFGFVEAGERELFLLLLGVAGVGPKLAINILSGMPAEELVEALDAGDVGRLVSIPGVGRKTAERLVLELREKMSLHRARAGAPARVTGVEAEAVSALLNLGYRRADAERAVKAAQAGGVADLERVIREALKRLSA
jgi:Holliday junction DNA helicase RuvA